MSSCEGDIQSANPPADPKPDRPAIAKTPEPNKKTEEEPGDQHDHCRLEEHGLRLRELLDLIEVKDGSRKRDGVANPGVHQPTVRRSFPEQTAGASGSVEDITGVATAQSSVVAEGVAGTRPNRAHPALFGRGESFKERARNF
uniref:Uncharacterized protein n=1 Tax=Vitis vinifera TaxID=29760 RepID=A5ALW0_VITVI|nr:hypothetical protein VITISV_000805 [Vitis vinifera]